MTGETQGVGQAYATDATKFLVKSVCKTAPKSLLDYSVTQTKLANHKAELTRPNDVTAAILVFQNNKTAAMLVYQDNPMGIELFSYVKTFFLLV